MGLARRDMLGSPDNMKSYGKNVNVSVSKDLCERKKVKLLRKQSSKRKLRPSSHRRVLRQNKARESDVSKPNC